MERSKRTTYEVDGYPDLRGHIDRRSVLAGLGVLAGVAVAPLASSGCGVVTMPGMVAADPDSFWVYLPVDGETRNLYFSYNGYIDYHVVVTAETMEVAEFLADNRAALLEAIDAELASYSLYTYAPDEDHSGVEEALIQVLADAFAGVEGASTAAFLALDLVIDHYEEEEEIDGDMAAVR